MPRQVGVPCAAWMNPPVYWPLIKRFADTNRKETVHSEEHYAFGDGWQVVPTNGIIAKPVEDKRQPVQKESHTDKDILTMATERQLVL